VVKYEKIYKENTLFNYKMHSKRITGLAALVLSSCNSEVEIPKPLNLFDEDRIEIVDYQEFSQQRKPLTEEDLHDGSLPLPSYTNEIKITPNLNFSKKNKNLAAYIPVKPIEEKINALPEEKKVENSEDKQEKPYIISPDIDSNQFDLNPNADLLAQLLPELERKEPPADSQNPNFNILSSLHSSPDPDLNLLINCSCQPLKREEQGYFYDGSGRIYKLK